DDLAEHIRQRALALQQIVDDASRGALPINEAEQQLRQSGASAEEVADYVQQLQAARQQPPGSPARRQDPGSPDRGPEDRPGGLSGGEAANEVAWALLRQKLESLRSDSGQSGDLTKALLGLVGPSSERPPSIPSTVLAGAPHLAALKPAIGDEHIQETWRLRQLYSTEKAVDPIINAMQQQTWRHPLPRSIWKDLVADKFVSFERIFATMELGYDHDEDTRELAPGLSLVRKDTSSAKRPLRTEADWQRVFAAWADATKASTRTEHPSLTSISALSRSYLSPLLRTLLRHGGRSCYPRQLRQGPFPAR
ncbi:uncharacterized protein B0H18DRAFT_1147359, partial [Fomitopsis serialis]|uniref:uncharacterized protein n=1 Tax=Fomitopsis serialis TaxID=139415 RepID=UPI002007951E